MKTRTPALLVGLVFTGALAHAQMPAVSGSQGQTGSQDVSSAAKSALTDIKSARTNIGKKDYSSAKANIGNARENLKTIESSSGLGEIQGMTGAKTGALPISKAAQQLSGAQQALGKNDPKAADSLLKKAEGLLSSSLG